ncbi:MAG: hypothetical protein A2161_04640 [Candidatus Schekmanbacteria bacterium RBG_13_48_7]|uniref:Antifreeze protein type I n=1 Tax=Candidatus Schekmanbacteria bacterium RBG_13_48_7 TaxID=1817878 RepID=A0A1F7RP95_9BACT|nr:MAG: hypothetical protein A2161_04640 [Candidatus Schekmanbacteria bacterium RBG_13_48_7]
MALLDRIKHDADSDEFLVWKFPSEEIRLGSQLIVNQSQEAIFVKGGQALDLFGPGTYSLSTGNLPILGKIVNLPFGRKTPFSAEVWFVNKTVKRDLKWGTKTPIPLIDTQFNYPVNVRSFGRWGMRVTDARTFIVQIVGSQYNATMISKIEEYFIGEIVQRLSNALSRYFVEKNVSIFQVNARLNELSGFVESEIRAEFERFGIEIVNFNIERISIPDEDMNKFKEILGKRMEIDQISQAKVGQAYTTMRTFDTLDKAADNEGGGTGQMLGTGLGLGVGLGAGVPIGQQIGGAMNVQPIQKAPSDDPVVKLQKLKQMLDADLITNEDFETKKKQILDSI